MPPIDRRKEINARLAALTGEQEERLARRRAGKLRLPYVNLVAFPLDAEVLGWLPKKEAEAAGAILFYKKGRDVRLGAVNPSRDIFSALLDKLSKQLGQMPQAYVISQRSLMVALSRYPEQVRKAEAAKDELLISEGRLAESEEAVSNLEELGQRISSVPPGEILSTVIASALVMGASDIHVEPRRKEAQLRFRVDGVLHDVALFASEGWRRILSRVKVLSSLKINVHSVPQDGSFVLRVDGKSYDVRVSVLPGAFGENIVLRVFSRQEGEALELGKLGMKERDLKLVHAELKQSNGMVVAAGPTGSGKTTTIVACLREVNQPELKIITLEDPIEYRLKGIEQTQIDASRGYTFAVGLRSILRQDPDIIFVGEMRDVETAETSIHAAMTGHLVFSTVHANNAPGVILRIIDMGIKPYLLAPAINVVISQRLVRVVCDKCKEEYVVSVKMREHIREVMAGLANDVFDSAVLNKKGLKFVKAAGCTACGGTGYKGRIGVFEVFAVRDEIEELILQGTDSARIREAAQRSGMTTIAQDAYLKVIDTITTVAEVQRISEE